MQYGIYINEDRCMGCFACVVACKDWHDVPAGPASWMRVKTIEKGRFPNLFVAFLPQTCNHCLNPACVSVCPVNAITKRPEDGIVIVDGETCLGKDQCGLCLQACPYDAPQFGVEENARMQKCDLCLDRLREGEETDMRHQLSHAGHRRRSHRGVAKKIRPCSGNRKFHLL